MTRRNLILIHRGPEYEQDFREISEKVFVLDPEITIYSLATGTTDQLPEAAWQRPTLTVALNSKFNLKIRRGPVLSNYQVRKLAQHRIFREADIPTPPTQEFRIGMTLDPILFGEFVILKPMSLRLTSSGKGIHLFRRRNLEKMTAKDFPADHLVHRDAEGYLVQKFIDTGERVSDNRVSTFFGRVLYANCATARTLRPDLRQIGTDLCGTAISSLVMESDWRWHADEDTLQLAQKVHAAFPDIPLLGTDILREADTGKLYVLECNPGGNTWHFSSPTGRKWQFRIGRSLGASRGMAKSAGRKMLLEQFGAIDIVAHALVEKTRELAT